MKNKTAEIFSGTLRIKHLIIMIISTLLVSTLVPFLGTNATVSSSGNTLSGANNNFVNTSNSGAYQVNFSLNGTLDLGDTFLLTASDGSGNTTTGSYLSASGGESSGSILLNLSISSQGALSYTGKVFSGGIMTQVVASGITLTGTLDTVMPGIVLSSTGGSTITGATQINITTSESVTGFTIGDISTINATTSGFAQTSATGYTVMITPIVSTGTVLVSIGSGMIQDLASNPNTTSNILSFNAVDTIAPVVVITSHASGAIVTGSPTLSGTVSDSGGVASVMVNGSAATLGTGTWSKVVSNLVAGANMLTVIATDTAGNTGSTTIVLNRVSLPSNVNATLSGTSTAVITFNTDITATGVVLYGTSIGSLNLSATGTTPGTSHTITLTGLLPNTLYYYRVQGKDGTQSAIQQFKTPALVSTNASGSIVATGSIYLSGSTGTGATFSGSGSITLLSVTSSGSQVFFPLNGLTIIGSGGTWDGVIQAPEITSNPLNLTLSGYAFTGTAYQIGNARTSLIFSGQLATVTVALGASLSGQTILVYRSDDGGTSYNQITMCVVTGGGNCIFTTNRLSLFGFAMPADTIPNTFSFTALTDTELATQYTSNTVTISGTTAPTMISITGGEYRINNGVFTTATGSINSGDTVTLRAVSSASNSTNTNAVVTVGGVSGVFSITTKAASGGGGGGGGMTGPGGGGGGGGGGSADYCPGGDYTSSNYDGLCGTPGSSSSGIIITPPGIFNIPGIIITNLADINFRDISNNWAQAYIIRLVIRGIVDNVTAYHPNNNLTRAEFLKIVINTTGWEVPTKNLTIPFDDVRVNSWYAKYVSLALSKGMISGDNISFRPNYTITRAEAMKILMTALGVTISTPTSMSFVDVSINTDLAKYIEAGKYLNVISGQIVRGEHIFRPNDSITRAEIAKVVVNAFHL